MPFFVLQLNFLVQKEILSAKSTRLRADVLAHFIKVAKVSLYLVVFVRMSAAIVVLSYLIYLLHAHLFDSVSFVFDYIICCSFYTVISTQQKVLFKKNKFSCN